MEWLSRIIAVNSRLTGHCKSNGWAFINNWDLFYAKDTLYARDGVDLSWHSVRVLVGFHKNGKNRKTGGTVLYFRDTLPCCPNNKIKTDNKIESL